MARYEDSVGGKYELAIEDFFHPKKIVAKGGDNSFGTKQNVRSSWTDSIVGVESPTLPHCRKKSAARSENFLRHEHLQSSISRSVEKWKETSVARTEAKNSNCWPYNKEWLCYG
jgi:hypothetical protein